MTWTKLGDEFGDQCWKLSDAAFRLHTEALVWSNRKHLDGRLDKAEMRQWAKRPEAAEQLVGFGWWEDKGDCYQIVYHLGWQRTAADWLHQSEVNKANQAKRKARRGRNSGKANNETNNESFNESFNETNNERDRTGQDRTGLLKEGITQAESGDGPPSSQCRFCGTELTATQQHRGYCNADDCLQEAW